MATIFKTIRCTKEELESWREVSNGNLNGWIRTSLNSQVELDKALLRLSDNIEPHG